MDEINAGDYDQLTYEQIREFYPIEYKKRAEDKLGYRYPNGESYIDLSLRVNESLKKLDFMTKENVYDNHSHFKGTLLSSRSSFSAFPILFGKASNEKLEAGYSTLKMVIFGLKFNFVTKNIIVNILKGSFFNLSPSCRPMHFGNFAQFTKRGNSSY